VKRTHNHRNPHSFPTRRSSDLIKRASAGTVIRLHLRIQQLFASGLAFRIALAHVGFLLVGYPRDHRSARNEQNRQMTETQRAHRSEEHTSELQSRENLVCRLLL